MATGIWRWRDGDGGGTIDTGCPEGAEPYSGLGNRQREVSIVLPRR